MDKITITGGTGMVGTALKNIIPDAYYPTHKDMDLIEEASFDDTDPINIDNTEEYSIKEVVSLLCEYLEYDGKITWNTNKPSGQYRKPSDNSKFIELGWKQKNYTDLKKDLTETYKWVIINYPNMRGIK